MESKETSDLEHWDKVLAACVAYAETTGNKLSDWEYSFLESVLAQWEEKQWLSDKQRTIVDRIWSKAVNG